MSRKIFRTGPTPRPTRTVAARQLRAAVDALEPRYLLSSGALTPLVQFHGADGLAPQAVVMDAAGNLFGITYDSAAAGVSYGPGQHGPGEIFEVPAGTQNIQVLATFSQNAYVGTSLVIDSTGNLFGTELPDSGDGGASLPPVVFELPTGTTTITPIATLPAGTIGTFNLTAVDSTDDVFGTSTFNGPFEVVNGSGSVTYLQGGGSTLNASDLYVAVDGTIYGTTYAGGDNSDGSIFRFAAGTHAYAQLASFDGATNGSKPLGVVADAAGNLFGFCENGGPNGNGTVFELPAGSNTLSLLATFTAATGDTPISRPVLGASGTLYGLTDTDGANGFGSLFSLATPDASATPAILTRDTSSGLPGGSGPDQVFSAAEPSTAVNNLADLDSSEEAGQNTAGIVAGNDPGDISDRVNNILDIWGSQFGTSIPDSAGGSGGIDKWAPDQPKPVYTVPTPDVIKNAQDRADRDEQRLEDARNKLRKAVEDGGRIDPAVQDYNDARKDLHDANTDWNALREIGPQVQSYDRAQSEIDSLTGAQIRLARATGPSAASGASAQKLAADRALVAKLGPQISSKYSAALADLTSIETDLASFDAFLSSLPTAPILTVTVAKDTLPASVVAGTKLHASLTAKIANSGTAAKGRGSITLYASATPTLDGATMIGSPKTVAFNIPGGHSATIAIPITSLPPVLPDGAYYIIAQASFSTLTIAPAASAQTVTVAQPS